MGEEDQSNNDSDDQRCDADRRSFDFLGVFGICLPAGLETRGFDGDDRTGSSSTCISVAMGDF